MIEYEVTFKPLYVEADGIENAKVKAVYPDMNLYQEIILLKYHFKGDWVIENTESYYNPLIKPQKVGRHYIWSNKIITDILNKDNDAIRWGDNKNRQQIKGFNIDKYALPDKRKILRNCVKPEVGKHIFDCLFKIQQKKL